MFHVDRRLRLKYMDQKYVFLTALNIRVVVPWINTISLLHSMATCNIVLKLYVAFIHIFMWTMNVNFKLRCR
jgi:hypothetical protein